MRTPITPYWAAAVPGLALAAGAARWFLQGSHNLYTAPSRRYYMPDPDLGWRVMHDGPLWLGLEVLAAMAAAGMAVLAAAWLIRRRERRQQRPWPMARTALWCVAVVPLTVPVWAFASGFGPTTARDHLPMTDGSATRAAPADIQGSVAGAPAGRYEVVPHEGSAITARIKAGGEAFDTRFTGDLSGYLTIDPGDLRGPLEAEIRVDAASVNTGIEMRSKHAREYLKVDEFPALRLSVSELLAAQQGADAAELAFWARGRLELMGSEHSVTLIGRLRAPDHEGRQRLGLSAPSLLVSADFALQITETPLSADAGDFDAHEIPIHASLILSLAPGSDAAIAEPETPQERTP